MENDSKEAIRARIDRFNRLWMAAEGHTFEEDPQWYEKEILPHREVGSTFECDGHTLNW